MAEQGRRTAVKTAQLRREFDPSVLEAHRLDLLRRYTNMLGHRPLDDLPSREFVMKHVEADLQKLGFQSRRSDREKKVIPPNSDPVTYGGFCYNPGERLLTMTGHPKPVWLPPLEGIIMHTLITNGGKTVAYKDLLEEYQTGCSTDNPTVENLRVTTAYLRERIGDKGKYQEGKRPGNRTKVFAYIVNIKGLGYKLIDPSLGKVY